MDRSSEETPGWIKGPSHTSVCANGSLIRELRIARGLTQEQFAELAGYSTRLVRKAEAGRPLHADTVEVLAEALSVPGAPVSPETLITGLKDLVRRFCKAYAFDEVNLAKPLEDVFAPNCSYRMAGDPAIIPFAGTYDGIEGLDQWARNFFSVFERPFKDLYMPDLYQEGTTVVAIGHDAARIVGMADVAHSITVVRFEFERGKIVLGDNDYDTHAAAGLLQRARAHGYLPRQ